MLFTQIDFNKKMEFTFKTTVIQEETIAVQLLPELVSYWKLRKTCSPYETQFVRAIRQRRGYRLMALTESYGEWSIKFSELSLNNSLLFADKNLNLRGNEFAHLNGGLTSVLFAGRGEHSSGSYGIERIKKAAFDNALNTATIRQYDYIPFWIGMEIVLSNKGIIEFGKNDNAFQVLDVVVSPEKFESGVGLVTTMTENVLLDSRYFKPNTPELRWYE